MRKAKSGEDPSHLPDGWREVKLEDVAEVNTGKNLEKGARSSKGKYEFVGANGRLAYTNSYILDGEYILTGRVGTIGQVTYKKGAFYPSDNVLYIKSRGCNDNRFLFYLLSNEYLENLNVGSTQPLIKQSDIRNLLIHVPFLHEQKTIAEVLSSLDDKIDLLHRQNKTLEDMAQTLFRQWFVEEADEKAEKMRLSDYVDHKKVNIKPYNNPTTSYTHYSIPSFDNDKKQIINFGKDIKSNKYKVFGNSILISKLNPRFPRIWRIFGSVDNDAICSTEFQVALPKSKNTFSFLYCFLQSKFATNRLIGSASGTSGSHQRVRPEYIFNLPIISTDEIVLRKFSQVTDKFWEAIFNNQSQIHTLEYLRDTLLPKLITGKIKVI